MQAKILIIENESALAEKIFNNLVSFNYIVLPVVICSEEVIPCIERQNPDLIILDLEFSGNLDGISLAEIISKRFDKPMIYVTESSERLALSRVQLTNPYGFVLKDFDPFRFAIVISITFQKYNTEKQLRESENRLRMIANFTYDWEYWMDESGHFVYISPAVERVTGYTPAEFIQNPGLLQEIVHPLDLQMSKDHSEQRKKTLGLCDFKLRIVRRDGEIRWIQHICQPVVNEGGGYFGHYATNHDITEQQIAENTLGVSEKRYRSLFEDSRISLWEEDFSEVKQLINELREQGIKDLESYFHEHPDEVIKCMSLVKVLDINNAGLVMYKAPDKETLIQNTDKVFSAADPLMVTEEILAIANGAMVYDGEGTNSDLEGNPIDVQLHWSVPPDSTDKFSRVLVSIIDITSRRKRERSLEVVSTVSAAVRVAQTRREMLEVISDQITRLFETDGWGAILTNDDGLHCNIEFASGIWAGKIGKTFGIIDPDYHEFLTNDQPVIFEKGKNFPPIIGLDDNYASLNRIICPLVTEEKILGGMVIARKSSFAEVDKNLLHSLSNILAVALYRTSLLDKTRIYADHMAAISTMGRRLTQTLNLNEIYEYLGQGVLQLFPDISTIFLSDYDLQTSTNICVYGIYENEKIDVTSLPPMKMMPPGTGTTSEEMNSHQPLVVNHFEENYRKMIQDRSGGRAGDSVQSAIYIPLVVKDEPLGILQLQSTHKNRFSQTDVDLLMPLASTGAIAIKNSRSFTETEERLQRLSVLHTIDTAISSSLELKVTLNILTNELTSFSGFIAADVLLYDSTRQILEFSAGRGFQLVGSEPFSIRIGEGFAGKSALSGKVIICTDVNDPCFGKLSESLSTPDEFKGYAAVPMFNKGQVKGVLEVFFASPKLISEEWLEFLETLAGQVAVAIDNSNLVQQLQRSNLELTLAYDSTLEGWSKALDLRDRETEGHSRRVTDLTVQLAETLGQRDNDLVNIRRGSLLHDIGKMGIPDSILLKDGPLSPEEWVIMRKHPVYAFEMLSPINYLSKSLDIPYCHHEHWDGRGYPRGLKEEQIPLAARIFAVADVYDSLVSDRPYRKAWTKQKALQQIKDEAGTHLDASIVEIFLRIME